MLREDGPSVFSNHSMTSLVFLERHSCMYPYLGCHINPRTAVSIHHGIQVERSGVRKFGAEVIRAGASLTEVQQIFLHP